VTKLRVQIQIQLFTTDTSITLSQLGRNDEKLKRYRLICFLFMKFECQKRNFIVLEKHDPGVYNLRIYLESNPNNFSIIIILVMFFFFPKLVNIVKTEIKVG